MGNQNANQKDAGKKPAQLPTTGKTTAEQVNNTEETISSFIRDCQRNIKNSVKGLSALENIPAGTPEMKTSKENMIVALKGQREAIAKTAAQKVYEYLLKVE